MVASPVVLVVGGAGAFGSRVAERLARNAQLQVVLAGRTQRTLDAAAKAMSHGASQSLRTAVLDAMRPDIGTLKTLAPAVIINASGPFQAQDYALAEAAIATGAHYVDLADAREFVTGITRLDAMAKSAGVLVASGASSVPALAAAIIDSELAHFRRLDTIEHAITPANGYDPGAATTASILGGLGRTMPMLVGGIWRTEHGWLGLRRINLPGIGWRLMTHCDVPDLELFPSRYPGVRTVRFCAGLDVTMFQLGLWALAGLARAGLLRRPERLTPWLMGAKRQLRFLGGEIGGMLVRLEGEGLDGRALARSVTLIARDNMGPYVPAIASVIVARKLALDELATRGAMPCLGLMSLDEFKAEVADLPVELRVD